MKMKKMEDEVVNVFNVRICNQVHPSIHREYIIMITVNNSCNQDMENVRLSTMRAVLLFYSVSTVVADRRIRDANLTIERGVIKLA